MLLRVHGVAGHHGGGKRCLTFRLSQLMFVLDVENLEVSAVWMMLSTQVQIDVFSAFVELQRQWRKKGPEPENNVKST